jgi:hypothetical protein
VTSKSIHTLLHTLVDYAGLFPPAGLSMQAAVANYADYRRSPHAWVLGRFIVPVSRLDEMAAAMKAIGAPDDGHAWRISVLAGESINDDVATAGIFNGGSSNALIDALEVKAASVDAIRAIARVAPREMKTYVEIPVAEDPRALVDAIAAVKLRAKIRTGGVTPEAIPSVEQVGAFMRACYAAGVGFKATAGLHHALRAERALTYAPDAPRGVMHGFLNVFLAAAFQYNGLTIRDAHALLAAGTLDGVEINDDRLAWREYVVTLAELSTIRRRFAIAFGSCSFTEPVEDLVQMELLT